MNSRSDQILQQLFDQPICINSSNLTDEANQNLHYLTKSSFSDPNRYDEVNAFFDQVIRLIREKLLLNHAGHPMLLYSWFDEQAAQLRFSLISTTHNELPFNCSVQRVDDLEAVVSQFLEQSHQGIDTSELIDASDDTDESDMEEEDYVLYVWTKQIQ